MSCVLLFRDIGGVPIDVVISETATAGMEIPEHPVERGAKISDHAWRRPTTLRLSCASEYPQATYQSLIDVMKVAEPFDVITGFGLFENMLIESIEPTRDVETSQILQFEASLKEVIIVSTTTSGEGDERGSGETNRGQVQAQSSEDFLYDQDSI